MKIDRALLLIFVSFPVALALGAWVTFFAPCSSLGWVPVKDLPARCLAGVLK